MESDLRLTSTTDGRIERLIHDAALLRGQYRVPTGFQRAPFFEVQTADFALLAIDTGVRKIDGEQERWLDGALARAAGKTIMAVVGHPFFAGGHDVTLGDDEFTRLKRTLLDRGVTIVMGGDTHDLDATPNGAALARCTTSSTAAAARTRFRHGVELARRSADGRLGALSESAGCRDED